MARTYTRDDAARDRFLRESTGIGSQAPWAMTPGRYTSDDLDRIAAAADRYPDSVLDDGTDDDGRWADEDRDLSDMAEWRGAFDADGSWSIVPIDRGKDGE